MNDSDDSDDNENVMQLLNTVITVVDKLMEDSSSSSNDEKPWGGSRIGKQPNINRNFIGAYETLVEHYFNGEESRYTKEQFERRFSVPREVFHRVYNALDGEDPFIHKMDCRGKLGIHPLVKITTCFRMLAYGTTADEQDEKWQVSETVANNTLKDFTRMVVEKLGDEYLNRSPTDEEKEEILQLNRLRGFPGMFGSWDCKHFTWEKCPLCLAGQHKGKGKDKTLVLEAISDPYLRLWYTFFGEPGTLNDLNILNKSTIIAAILKQTFNTKVVPYKINGNLRDWLYFLVDGIYPRLAIFVLSILQPSNKIQEKFKCRHEFVRKDVERAFGVIVQSKGILKRPLRNWYLRDIVNILNTCVILHNMTIESRKDAFVFHNLNEGDNGNGENDESFTLFGFVGSNDTTISYSNNLLKEYHIWRRI